MLQRGFPGLRRLDLSYVCFVVPLFARRAVPFAFLFLCALTLSRRMASELFVGMGHLLEELQLQ